MFMHSNKNDILQINRELTERVDLNVSEYCLICFFFINACRILTLNLKTKTFNEIIFVLVVLF